MTGRLPPTLFITKRNTAITNEQVPAGTSSIRMANRIPNQVSAKTYEKSSDKKQYGGGNRRVPVAKGTAINCVTANVHALA